MAALPLFVWQRCHSHVSGLCKRCQNLTRRRETFRDHPYTWEETDDDTHPDASGGGRSRRRHQKEGLRQADIALINSVGNLAGFVSPYLVGYLKDLTGTTQVGMYALAAILVIGAILVLTVPPKLVNR